MRRGSIVLLLAVALGGCGHTKTVAPPPEEKGVAEQAGAEPASRPKRGEPVRKKAPPSVDDTDAVPLATSPAALLRPDAIAAVQDKLIERGYLDRSARSEKLDGKTQKALRGFQREQGLPATGTPDDLTVEKLGLAPADIFRSSDSDRK